MPHEVYKWWQTQKLNNRISRSVSNNTVVYQVDGLSGHKIECLEGSQLDNDLERNMDTHNDFHRRIEQNDIDPQYPLDIFKDQLQNVPKKLKHYDKIPDKLVRALQVEE